MRAITNFRRPSVVGCVTIGLLWAAALGVAFAQGEKQEPKADAPAGVAAGEERVGRYLQVAAPITDKTYERVQRTVDTFVAQAKKRGQWPVVILEIESGRTQFGKALDLAKYLTGPALNGATTVAYVPETLTGHGVLTALACNEIVLHRDSANETTEIGDAGEHETAIDETMRAGYRQIAESRRTVPVPIALKMLDRELELLEVQTENSREFALPTDLVELRKKKAVSEPKVVIAAGRPGRFTAAKAKELGFATLLAADRAELVRSLGLPRSALDNDPTFDGVWRTARIDITGPISSDLVDRTIALVDKQIKDSDANFLCFWIDSPGGSPEHSLRLATYIASLDPMKRRTVAYIATKARGDAAAIALACDQIVMHRGALLGGTGEAVIDEKNIAAVEQAIRGVARMKHRSPSLAAAMVNPELVVYRYTRNDNGLVDYFTDRDVALLPDAAQWRQGAAVEGDDETLLVGADRAEELGLAHDVVADFAEFKAIYGMDRDPQLIEPGWAQFLIDALNSPGMSWILLLIGGAALYAELHAPGIGVGGFIGAVCIVLYFWTAHLGGTAGWLEVLLFALGMFSVLLEIFVFPGVGIFGLGGGLLIIASLVLASQTFIIPQNEYQMRHVRGSLLAIVGAVGGVALTAAIMRRFLPHAPMFNRMVLEPPTGRELAELSRRESLGQFDQLLHARGTAYTPLLPGGKARIGEQLVDVVTDGEFIDRNQALEVVEVHGTRVVVRSIEGK